MNKQFLTNKRYLAFIIAVFFLFCANLLFNGEYFEGKRVLYSDELHAYSLYTDKSTPLSEIIFGDEVMRPIPRAINLLIFRMIGRNYDFYDFILLGNNFLLSFLVFFITYSLQNPERKDQYIERLLRAAGAGVLYIASRFMQSQIFSSTVGVMEAIPHAATLLIFFLLVKFVRNDDSKKYFIACACFAVALYSHERYMSLVIPLTLAPLLRYAVLERNLPATDKEKRNRRVDQEKPRAIGKVIRKVAVPATIFGLYMVHRLLSVSSFLRGTYTGTPISETFSVSTFIKFVIAQIVCILGINSPAVDRTGINYKDVPWTIYIFVIVSIACVLFIGTLTVLELLREKERRRDIGIILAMGLTTMAGTIAFSSVSVGIAFRFIYVSYSMFLILIFTMLSYISFHRKNTENFKKIISLGIAVCSSLYVLCAVVYDNYYRASFINIKNLIPERTMARSMYNVTLEAYPDDFENKTAVILLKDNWFTYITPDLWELFFTPYMDSSNLDVMFFQSLEDIDPDLLSGGKEPLIISADGLTFTDVTDQYLNEIGDLSEPRGFSVLQGKGTKSSPYVIQKAEDLALVRDLVNAGKYNENCYFRQIADIDLGIYDNWIPIGVVAIADMSQERENNFFFRGNYNGDGYAIYNLNCHSDGYLNHNGLFGMLDGTVMNLGIESGGVSGLAAGAITSQGTHRAVIFNCYNKAAVNGDYRTGGIVDYLSGGTVISCVNIGEVSGSFTAGIVSGTAAAVENCYATSPPINDEFYEGTIMGGGQFSASEIADVSSKLNKALRGNSSGLYSQGNQWQEDGELALIRGR